METAFSEKQIEYQLVQAYSPAAVQLPPFLNFVFDNCDHNPETPTWTTTHCTNGIIIQGKRRNGQPDEAPMGENTKHIF